MLQRALQSGMLVSVFETRPYGIVLGLLGFIDLKVVTTLTNEMLGVIPSWVSEDISKVEAIVAEIGDDAQKLNKELHEYLRKIQKVIKEAQKILELARKELKNAGVMVAKNRAKLGDAMALNLEKTILNVEKAIGEIQPDVDVAADEINKIEKEVQTELPASQVKTKITETVKLLEAKLECFRPAKFLLRMNKLADEALYGELMKLMAKDKAEGAFALELPPAQGAP